MKITCNDTIKERKCFLVQNQGCYKNYFKISEHDCGSIFWYILRDHINNSCRLINGISLQNVFFQYQVQIKMINNKTITLVPLTKNICTKIPKLEVLQMTHLKEVLWRSYDDKIKIAFKRKTIRKFHPNICQHNFARCRIKAIKEIPWNVAKFNLETKYLTCKNCWPKL